MSFERKRTIGGYIEGFGLVVGLLAVIGLSGFGLHSFGKGIKQVVDQAYKKAYDQKVMEIFDTNRDGRFDPLEISNMVKYDKDNDGALSMDEIDYAVQVKTSAQR